MNRRTDSRRLRLTSENPEKKERRIWQHDLSTVKIVADREPPNTTMQEKSTTPETTIIDTSALIDNPDVLYALQGIVDIPSPVIRELDGLKRSEKENVAQAARRIGRLLDRLGSCGDLSKGVKLSTGALVRVSTIYEPVRGLASERDNEIIGAALARKASGENVTLLTGDNNVRTIARAHGLNAEPCDWVEAPIGNRNSIDLEVDEQNDTYTMIPQAPASGRRVLFTIVVIVVVIGLVGHLKIGGLTLLERWQPNGNGYGDRPTPIAPIHKSRKEGKFPHRFRQRPSVKSKAVQPSPTVAERLD